MTTTPQPPTEARELKACPFCGGEALRLKNSFGFHIWCKNTCSCGVSRITMDTEADAVKYWNTRATPTTREVLEGVLREIDNLNANDYPHSQLLYQKLKQIIAKQLEKVVLGKGGE